MFQTTEENKTYEPESTMTEAPKLQSFADIGNEDEPEPAPSMKQDWASGV